jgi:hypothetical protein
VLGTIHGMMESGDLMPQNAGMPNMPHQELPVESQEAPETVQEPGETPQ